MRDDTGLPLDFMGKIDGVKSFDGVRARASTVRFGSGELRVAALEDIALRRESERALLEQIERLLALPMEKRTHSLRKRLPGGGSTL